jgi:hypothetical protein
MHVMQNDSVLFALTADRTLLLRADEVSVSCIQPWLPLHAEPLDVQAQTQMRAFIDVGGAGAFDLHAPAQLPPVAATLGRTTCHIVADDAWIIGPGALGHVALGDVDGVRRAHIEFSDAADTNSTLNFATALLLARMRRYLMHCAAVRAPDGVAWLLAGDARAGKTTTTLNLAHAGWGMLADDHVILFECDGNWCIEGWPRAMHVDTGWSHGMPTGIRTSLDPRTLASGSIVRRAGVSPESQPHPRTARLGAVLLPRVVADAPVTTIRPATHADAVAMLLRQTAWSMADTTVIASTLADITSATHVPAFHLQLARDTFADPRRLSDLIRSALR